MVSLTYPGVYVVEKASGARPIAGASTSIGMFVGRAQKGPIGRPVRLTNLTEFLRTFGDDGGAVSDMARYVKLFFMNGGSDLYVLRIANGAQQAQVQLRNEADTASVLTLRAKAHGASGETIRARVRYGGEEPEGRFTLEVFRWGPNAAGVNVESEAEIFVNLTMNPNDPLYAQSYVTQNSALVDAVDTGPAGVNGIAILGRPLPANDGDAFRTAFAAAVDGAPGAPGGTHFAISVDGLPFVEVDLTGTEAAVVADAAASANTTIDNALIPTLGQAITQAYQDIGTPGVSVTVGRLVGPTIGGTGHRYITIRSDNQGDIRLRPATGGKDISATLMMGPANGGLEIGAHAARRPAPTGISIRFADAAALRAFSERQNQSIVQVDLPGLDAAGNPATVNIASVRPDALGNALHVTDTYATSANGHNDGVRQRLNQLRDAINAFRTANPRLSPWTATTSGLRLTVTSATAGDTTMPTFAAQPNDFAGGTRVLNVPRYTVGAGGIAGLQVPTALPAGDGNPAQLVDYTNAFATIDEAVRDWNIMVLPRDNTTVQDMQPFVAAASAFCRQQRGFLIVDPPETGLDPQAMATAADALRVGVAIDHAAVYYPNILISEAGRQVSIGPAGAMAGVYARTDQTRGIWKGPAGQDLPILGITGVARQLSDGHVGILNPRGVNCITQASSGIRPWGVRTLAGANELASEWNYVNVRRTALYIEESLYQGLQWTVFEPNGETLWGQITFNVDAFMNRMFRDGAFKGTTKAEAYFVHCNAETTTQADIDIGVVNVNVGFAPLKPAEFVVLTLQQIAGQADT
ncbi:phage tail sheath subtilisin-like domain-containing protein [Tropicibacter sp. S64]|uniref:phage tail sheath subtilisin-like domain-containing protein n=1 Tax=Tropicibacter sp. S64 TaxID=3415122 RepID=UPI003C7CB1B9